LLPILVAFTTKCSTKSSADRCRPPKGGSACVGVHASCCDACTASDCASPSGALRRRLRCRRSTGPRGSHAGLSRGPGACVSSGADCTRAEWSSPGWLPRGSRVPGPGAARCGRAGTAHEPRHTTAAEIEQQFGAADERPPDGSLVYRRKGPLYPLSARRARPHDGVRERTRRPAACCRRRARTPLRDTANTHRRFLRIDRRLGPPGT